MGGIKMNEKKYIIGLLFLIGMLLLAHGLYIPAKAQVAQILLNHAWETSLAERQPVKPWPWADTYPVARLTVPSQAINQIVLAGDEGNSLAFGPGLNLHSDLGKDTGIVEISGHRDTHFHFLKDLKPDDSLLLETPDRHITHYRVLETRVVNTKHTKFHVPNQGQWMVLVTCYPFNAIQSNPRFRFVVIALATTSPDIKTPAESIWQHNHNPKWKV